MIFITPHIVYGANDLAAIYEKKVRERDIKDESRFQILLHFYFRGPTAPVQLAKQLKVSRANISNFLVRLKNDGLIEEFESNSKRPIYTLTSEGLAYFEKIFPAHIAEVDKTVEELPEPVIQMLLGLSGNIDPDLSSLI